MRATLVRLLGALFLVVIAALAVSTGRFSLTSSPGEASVAVAAPQHAASAPVSMTTNQLVSQGDGSSGNCWQYDSWCNYCTLHADASVCSNYAHPGQSSGPSTSTTGSGAASTATAAATAKATAAATATPTATPASH